MWYVIQTKTGEEDKLKILLENRLSADYYEECFIPLFESVRHRRERSLIMLKRLLPGYLFIDTEYPVKVHEALRKIPNFADVLGVREERDKEKTFLPISKEDEDFFKSILDNGIMHVSYVHLSKSNKIDKVIGPLEKYRNYIGKMEFRHRYATVEAKIFGKRRKIDFGLWTESDPRLPWLEERIKGEKDLAGIRKKISAGHRNMDIYPGDKIEYPEIYGDRVFRVDDVDMNRGLVHTTIEMFGSIRKVEMYVDCVRKVI